MTADTVTRVCADCGEAFEWKWSVNNNYPECCIPCTAKRKKVHDAQYLQMWWKHNKARRSTALMTQTATCSCHCLKWDSCDIKKCKGPVLERERVA